MMRKGDCARPATTPRVGMPKALARLHPMCNDRVKTPARGRSKAGSDSQPEPAMSALSGRTFLNFPPRLVRCCSRKQDPSPPEPSMSRPLTRTSRSPAPSSACSCCGACACPCRSRRADAPAMGSLIPWAIIVPPAPPQGFCRRAPCPSSMQSHASVVKPARGSPVTSGWPT